MQEYGWDTDEVREREREKEWVVWTTAAANQITQWDTSQNDRQFSGN